jgi:hypothetical protein
MTGFAELNDSNILKIRFGFVHFVCVDYWMYAFCFELLAIFRSKWGKPDCVLQRKLAKSRSEDIVLTNYCPGPQHLETFFFCLQPNSSQS